MPNFENMTPEQMKILAEQMRQQEYAGLTPEEQEEKKRRKEAQKQENIARLGETLEFCRNGFYEEGGKSVGLGLTEDEMREARVFLPDEIAALPVPQAASAAEGKPCATSCENLDALSLAGKRIQEDSGGEGVPDRRVFVLNLAGASRPGGAVRDGANGQEEDLCRKSSLLLSLESPEAAGYYTYSKSLNTHLGSDAVIYSPNVAVFRDSSGGLLEQPFLISVLSCSAPMIRLGLEGRTEEEYHELLLRRICGILRCAGSLGCESLILGAFGCGVFGNDAAVVSDLFKKALAGPEGAGFRHVDFAVLCQDGKDYNYSQFARNFSL